MTDNLKLSDFERLTLRNQYLILSRLDEEQSNHWEKRASIMESGFESEYAEDWMEGSVSVATSKFVYGVFSMYQALQRFRDDHPEAGLSERAVQMPGFCGNTECEHLSYARHILSNGQFTHVARGAMREGDLNAHMPCIDLYQGMLPAWKESTKDYDLTREDVERILSHDPTWKGAANVEG